MALNPQTRAKVEDWLRQDPDPATIEQLRSEVTRSEAGDAEAIAAVESQFSGPLTFGTAGLRAALGPGPARMNRVVVSRAAAGVARWLDQHGHGGGTVLIGFDARHNSDVFARDTAEIMAAAGFRALLTDRPTPTPVVAFGIRHFDCVAAVVVTASHNPPQDNGYKVYLGDGSQIIPPTDSEIAEQIGIVSEGPLQMIPRSSDYRVVGDELREAYIARAASLVPADAPREVRWAYTAMHGVGAAIMAEIAGRVGFPPAAVVAEQRDPDPDFPTVPFPNPEEPGAMDLAIALAEREGVDLAVASDPDADRCAVAAPIPDETGQPRWRMLTGDELGSLLGDDAMRRGVPGTFANSVVSSTLLGRMARARGRDFTTTLTGFKWIGRVPDLAFGYEEAIGYCCDAGHVSDKDGLTAGTTVLRLAADLRSQGRTIADRLDDIARQFGVHATSQLAMRVSDLSLIADAMARVREAPPTHLAGDAVTMRDLRAGGDLPPTDAVEFTGESVHVVVRPSGTEPKLKCYLEVRCDPAESQRDLPGARAAAAERLSRVRADMAAALGIG